MINHKNTAFHQALSQLILNAHFIPGTGLFHGRMGCVLFLAVYARHTQNEMYENFASELLDTIYEDLNKELHFNLEDGLCGIGWGIEYLVQQGLMQGDTDEILWEVDQRIMEYNPLRISDLSFRRGLGGLTFYVIARLLAVREIKKIPFDWNYLQSLKTALSQANLSEDPENPIGLKNLFIEVLQGEKHPKIDLPPILKYSNIQLDEEISSFGLDQGIAGALWTQLLNCNKEELVPSPLYKKGVFIFDVKVRGTNYGIGTYMSQLINTIQTIQWNLVIIHFFSEKTNTFFSEEIDGVVHLDFSQIKEWGYINEKEKRNRLYYRSAFLLLKSYVSLFKHSFFHLNYMHEWILAEELKVYYPLSKIILTVHYTDWSFCLQGNKEELYRILSHTNEKENKFIIDSFNHDKQLLNSCDHIISIAQHSYKDLVELYQIPSNKITLISHGIKDCFRNLTGDEKIELRAKYGFQEKEQLILFAGRLDAVKGVSILVKTFISLASQNPLLRLIIAGDGDYSKLLSLASPYWSQITFTGFLDKTELYELYQICNMGILPSLHEEFGYVALEMMMMEVPLIAGRTTGLSELIISEETGLLITVSENELSKAINRFLESPFWSKQLAKKGRKRFLDFYEKERFINRMKNYYENL